MEDKKNEDNEFIKEHIGRKISLGYGSKLKIDEVYRSLVILVDSSGKESTMEISKVAEIVREEIRVTEANMGYDVEQYIKDKGILTNVFTNINEPMYDSLSMSVMRYARSLKNMDPIDRNINYDKGNGFKTKGFHFYIITNPPGTKKLHHNDDYICYVGNAEMRNISSSYQWAKQENGVFFTNVCKEPNSHINGHVYFIDPIKKIWTGSKNMEIVHREKADDIYDDIRNETIKRLTSEIVPYMNDTVDYKESFQENFETYWFINRDTNVICLLIIEINYVNTEHERTEIKTYRFEDINKHVTRISIGCRGTYNIPKRCNKMSKEAVENMIKKNLNEVVDRWVFNTENNKI